MKDVRPRSATAENARHQIVEVRPAREGEMYSPDTPWRRHDNTPRPVPVLDADGNPSQISGAGPHPAPHNATPTSLNCLPPPLPPPPPSSPPQPLALPSHP